MADRAQVYAGAAATSGAVDLVVNNAGIVKGGLLNEVSDAQDELTVAVNTLAHVWMTKAFLPGMEQRGRGHFCNVSSFAGYYGAAGLVTYAASKYGARGFADALAAELRFRKSPVKVTCVCPSYVVVSSAFKFSSC